MTTNNTIQQIIQYNTNVWNNLKTVNSWKNENEFAMLGCYGNLNCFISPCKVTDISYTSTQFSCLSVSSRLVSLRETSTKRKKRSLIETAGITFPKATNGRALYNHAQPFWPLPLTIVYIFRWAAGVDCCEWQRGKPVSPELLNGMETSKMSTCLRLWRMRTHPLTNYSDMDRQVPAKTGCDAFELEGLGALWDVWHPFNFIRLNHHLFLIMASSNQVTMFVDCGMKPVYLENTTREGHA